MNDTHCGICGTPLTHCCGVHGRWCPYCRGKEHGAAGAFGLMGMAEAIRRSKAFEPLCEKHGLPFDYYIGAGMTACRACFTHRFMPDQGTDR